MLCVWVECASLYQVVLVETSRSKRPNPNDVDADATSAQQLVTAIMNISSS